MAAIDEDVTRSSKMPAEKRKAAERLLRDDSNLVRQRPEHDRNVVNALMVGDEDVRAIRIQPFESRYLDVHAGRDEDEPRPRPRAPVRKASAALEETRRNRQRAKKHRVDGDGGNQIENRPPPVIGMNCQDSYGPT